MPAAAATMRSRLLSSDTFQEPAPVQLGIYLFHHASQDPCEAWLTERLRFDLSPIRELYRTVYGVDSGVVVLRLAHADSEAGSTPIA